MGNFWARPGAGRKPAGAPEPRGPYAQVRVEVAIRLAASPDYADRPTAGHLLAEEAGDEQIDANRTASGPVSDVVTDPPPGR